MERSKINYAIDVLLGISFLLVFVTGILKWPGLLFRLGISIKSLSLKSLSRIHDWSGLVMGMLVFIHLIMHWKWIVVMTKKIFKGNR